MLQTLQTCIAALARFLSPSPGYGMRIRVSYEYGRTSIQMLPSIGRRHLPPKSRRVVVLLPCGCVRGGRVPGRQEVANVVEFEGFCDEENAQLYVTSCQHDARTPELSTAFTATYRNISVILPVSPATDTGLPRGRPGGVWAEGRSGWSVLRAGSGAVPSSTDGRWRAHTNRSARPFVGLGRQKPMSLHGTAQ